MLSDNASCIISGISCDIYCGILSDFFCSSVCLFTCHSIGHLIDAFSVFFLHVVWPSNYLVFWHDTYSYLMLSDNLSLIFSPSHMFKQTSFHKNSQINFKGSIFFLRHILSYMGPSSTFFSVGGPRSQGPGRCGRRCGSGPSWWCSLGFQQGPRKDPPGAWGLLRRIWHCMCLDIWSISYDIYIYDIIVCEYIYIYILWYLLISFDILWYVYYIYGLWT